MVEIRLDVIGLPVEGVGQGKRRPGALVKPCDVIIDIQGVAKDGLHVHIAQDDLVGIVHVGDIAPQVGVQSRLIIVCSFQIYFQLLVRVYISIVISSFAMTSLSYISPN